MNRTKKRDTVSARTQAWVGTWAEVEQAQLETMLRATPAQRLAWLEEAMRLAFASDALGTDRGGPPGPPSEKARATVQLDAADDNRDGSTDQRMP